MPADERETGLEEWDRTLQRRGGHFLQSSHWMLVQQRFGHTVVRDQGPDWMWSAHRRQASGISYLYAPYGPTLDAPEALAAAAESLHRTARERDCSFVRIEPIATSATGAPDPAASGWQRVTAHQPELTRTLDLSPGLDELRRGLSKGHRSGIGAAARRGVSVRRSQDPADMAILCRMLERTSGRSNFSMHPPDYYAAMADVLLPRGAGRLYIAEADSVPVAAAMGFLWGATAMYAHAGADPARARELNAPLATVWAMIEDAVSEGRQRFDFWGVAPTDAAQDHPWRGFSQFKRSFGGTDLALAGTWERPVHGVRYRVYRLAKAVRR